MNFSIETAALSAAFSMAIIASTFLYLWKLIPENQHIKWWAIGYFAITIDYLIVFILPFDSIGFLIPLWEAVHATFVAGLLIGVLYLLQRKPRFLFIIGLWFIMTGWGVFSAIFKPTFFIQTIPATIIASGVILYSGWILFTHRPSYQAPGYRLAGLSFFLWGLNRLDFSFIELIPWFIPFGYMIAQFTAIAMGIGLIISVLEMHRHRAIQSVAELEKSREQILNLHQELQNRAVALETANKELDAFADTVSHDLRAPLRHVGGFLELLQKEAGTALNEQSRHYMDTISESAKKMGLLIDDLLSFSRMGRQALSFKQVEMEPLVRDVIRELEPDTAGRTIEWRLGDLPSVNGDERMLRIVMTNLISNALKFTRTRQEAQIEIGSQTDPDAEGVIFVRDNGVGFDMAYADKLFGVFQRLHRSEEFEGTGIGLASVSRIIARHGGRTWAKGEPDQGAAFYFALPRTLQERRDGDKGVTHLYS